MTWSLVVFLIVGVVWYYYQADKKKVAAGQDLDPKMIRKELLAVPFYNNLNDTDKDEFVNRVRLFLQTTVITGIKTEVTNLDRVLISAAGIIPVFQFKDWQYSFLQEVIVYPGAFDAQYNVEGKGRGIVGLVGNGYMEGKMILSQKALRRGFSNQTDKRNVAIHEFLHLVDKEDGVIDGVPEVILSNQYVLPWLHLMKKKSAEIVADRSDLDDYALTNAAEFLTVTGTYFFERPHQFQEAHPKLYRVFQEMFQVDMREFIDHKVKPIPKIGRNDDCPCGSGEKFKECCES